MGSWSSSGPRIEAGFDPPVQGCVAGDVWMAQTSLSRWIKPVLNAMFEAMRQNRLYWIPAAGVELPWRRFEFNSLLVFWRVGQDPLAAADDYQHSCTIAASIRDSDILDLGNFWQTRHRENMLVRT